MLEPNIISKGYRRFSSISLCETGQLNYTRGIESCSTIIILCSPMFGSRLDCQFSDYTNMLVNRARDLLNEHQVHCKWTREEL
jgi:hypothetical protein